MPASEERTRANGQAATSSPERFSKFKMQAQNAVSSRSALLEKARRQAMAAKHSRTPEKGEQPSGLRAKEEELRAQVRAQQNKGGEAAGSPAELAGQMKDVLEGDCFFFGHGRPQSYEEGFKHYLQVAKTNYGPAMGRLGACFHHGRGVESDEALALEWYEKGADLGDADSMNALGCIHESGKLKSRGVDLERAFQYYKQAADAGHADGMTNLGYLYEKGHGVLQNLELASSWYERAAQKGYAKAQNNLGSLHYSGKGVRQSYWKAEEYYRLASAQGNASGMNNLAICLEEGLGTKKNVPEAIKLYEKAALLGNNNAAYNLGSLLLSRDEHTTAARWFRKVADEGNGDAVYNLGKLYEEGVGEELPQDLHYAGELYRRARDLGNGDAEEALGRRPGDGPLLLARGLALLLEGAHSEALRALAEARGAPGMARAAAHAAIYAHLGCRIVDEEAVQELRAELAGSPGLAEGGARGLFEAAECCLQLADVEAARGYMEELQASGGGRGDPQELCLAGWLKLEDEMDEYGDTRQDVAGALEDFNAALGEAGEATPGSRPSWARLAATRCRVSTSLRWLRSPRRRPPSPGSPRCGPSGHGSTWPSGTGSCATRRRSRRSRRTPQTSKRCFTSRFTSWSAAETPRARSRRSAVWRARSRKRNPATTR